MNAIIIYPIVANRNINLLSQLSRSSSGLSSWTISSSVWQGNFFGIFGNSSASFSSSASSWNAGFVAPYNDWLCSGLTKRPRSSCKIIQSNNKNIEQLNEPCVFKTVVQLGLHTFNSKLSMLRCLYMFMSLELCLRNNCAVFAMIFNSANLRVCVNWDLCAEFIFGNNWICLCAVDEFHLDFVHWYSAFTIQNVHAV